MTTTRVYKLTKPDLTTYNGFQYVPGQTYTFPGTGELCGPGWSHAYTSPQLALLLNPIHGNYTPCRLWEAEGVVGATDLGLKIGCSTLTLRREITVPEVTTEQRVTFAISCALAVYTVPAFSAWTAAWLSGEDRTEAAAEAARAAAGAAAWAAWAAEAARAAAWAAAWAAEAARAAGAAAGAAWAAAWAAAEAARAAGAAARAADGAADRVNLDALADAALLPWAP